LKLGRVRDALFASGALEALDRAWRGRLTVLAYHRVTESGTDGPGGLRANVSATPQAFDEQLAWCAAHFDPIGIGDLIAWLRGAASLPPRPLLITFDDGYRDNLDQAWPALRRHGMPALLFVATDCIDGVRPFDWDVIAWCLQESELTEAELPELGVRRWGGRESRERVAGEWLAVLKSLPDASRKEIVSAAPSLLDLTLKPADLAPLYLSADELRRLAEEGFDIGAHTRSHPILTRSTPEEAADEIAGSRRILEGLLGGPVLSFAYPNGLAGDFDPAVVGLVADAGFEAAFTLLPGPTTARAARRSPLTIRRIMVDRRDSLSRFVAKVVGLNRLGLVR
jgi:peptidoglycan/xylan/chitin deacetylase (PgdA/CDA1 family)